MDGLIETGAGKLDTERPFLRETTKIGLDVVFSKIPGWAFAWSLGWIVFWTIVVVLLMIVAASQSNLGSEDLVNFFAFLLSAGIGGFTGGLLAGLFTMLALRPNAPSISWKHMSPTIRIWGISGPLGIVVSGLITSLMIAVGALSVQSAEPDCTGIALSNCLGQIFGAALGEAIGLIILILFVFLLFVIAAWFLTGMFAGWQVVRHIRRLEPGITSGQGWRGSAGWGCGAIVAAVVMIVLIGILTRILGL